jgi:acetyl esterase/lipase
VLALPKALAAAAAPLVGLIGAIGAALGLVTHAPLAFVAGLLGAWASIRHIRQVTAPHDGFERAFGTDWQRKVSPERQEGLLKRRWRWRMPPSPETRWERDVAYHTIPATEEREARPLLCDVWRPPEGIASSGIGVVYLHGSAWHVGDKDLCTRPFFRHLAGQGHVVVDIAYRLYPETDILGMTHDVRHAVAWVKRQACRYGIDPARIVLGGGSAGGHLALLAAYTPGHPDLTPDSLIESDLSVRGVFAHYGAADMRAVLKHAGRVLPDQPSPSLRAVVSMAESVMGDAVKGVDWREFSAVTMVGNPLGGTPKEVPQMYDLASPITHVSTDCPPTLLLHGEHDFVMPPDASRQLHQELVEAGVASVLVTYPQTTHGFELFLPQISPAAQAATYEVDLFLSLFAKSPTA